MQLQCTCIEHLHALDEGKDFPTSYLKHSRWHQCGAVMAVLAETQRCEDKTDTDCAADLCVNFLSACYARVRPADCALLSSWRGSS